MRKRVVRKTSPRASSASKKKPAVAPAVPAASKTLLVIGLLERAEGATLESLMSVTGWQAHSVRGFLSGALRKQRGLSVERVSGNGTGTVYRIMKAE